MTGKVLVLLIVVAAVLAGAGMYYLQVYAYYEEVVPTGSDDVQLTPLNGDTPETILYEDFRAIDADSSPIRYRACFTTPTGLGTLEDIYAPYTGAAPRVAPGWFDCFDAEAIGAALAAGDALTFLSQKNVAYGVDRVVAITDDGRGFVWHELNDCGDKAYDGTVVGEECPPRENSTD